MNTEWIERKVAGLDFVLEQPDLSDSARIRAERMLRELKLLLADLQTDSDGECDD